MSNGQLATSGFEGNITTVREGNKYYAYDYTGKVVEQVDIVGNKWIEFNGGKYYFDSELTPYSGIQTIDGVEYYFNYGQLAEYLDEVVTSGDTLAYVRDGKVIEKAKFKDNELIYLNGNCYYYYLNDAGYYYPYDGEYTVDGKSLYFIYGMLQTSDSDEILTDYRNDYLYAYNNKGEIVDKVKRVAGWNEIGNDWYYVSSEMNFVDGIYTVNGKEYYFENGRLIKSSDGITVVSSYKDENDKIVTFVIAYNSEGVVVEKKKAVANTWIQLRGKWYYYDKNLNEAEGIETINGVKYIFSWGELLTASGNNIEVTTAYEKGKMLLVAYDKNGIVKETTVLTSRKLTEFIGNKYLYDRYYEPCTGWQEVDGTKYHFDADGKMTTGWLEEEKTWYYLDKDGQKTTGWLTLSGKKYYFDKEGKMVTGTVNVDGKDYTFNENGELNVETPEVKSGWVQSGNKWYYLNKSGVMVTGWAQIGWKWYYFNEDGAAVKDDVVIDGKTYTFRDDYSWISNCTRKEFVERAKRYLGCNEKDGSFKKIIDSYNKLDPLPRGYKVKYTDSWCMTFVSAMVRECNLLDIIPVECSCGKAVEKAQAMGIWQENDAYVPQIGDIIMYDWDDNGNGDNTGWPDHVGIVAEVNGNTFKVIEGNKNDAVEYRTMTVNGKFIRGYITPKFLS